MATTRAATQQGVLPCDRSDFEEFGRGAFGFCAPLSKVPTCIPGHELARHFTAEALHRTSRRRDALLVQKVEPGYNCRGNIWFGPARVETVYDTRSTRNSVDKGFLQALLTQPRTSSRVKEIVDVEPLTCESVDRNNPIVIKQIALIDTIFRESDDIAVTKLLGFCVVPNSTEDVILGKPTLDALGFVSDKHSIELQTEDIRFPTILPEKIPKGNDAILHLASHQAFDGRPDAARVFYPEFRIAKAHLDGRWWIEGGPDLPLDVEVVEGPLVPGPDGRCKVELIVEGNVDLDLRQKRSRFNR